MSDLPRGIPKGYFSGSVRGKDMAPKTKLTNFQSNTEVNDEEVAERIRQALENVDMTRREVAEAVGVAEKVIHAWARLGQISKHNLPRFAEVTGTGLDYLLTGRSAPSIYSLQETSNSVVEFSRELSSEITGSTSFTIRDCPVVNLADLFGGLPKEPIEKSMSVGGDILRNLIEAWVANPNTSTSLPMSVITSAPTALGLPNFAVQITTEIHAPDIPMGSIIAFTTDLIPDRNDFCVMARRPKGGSWSISGGFFSWDQRMVPGDYNDFFLKCQQENLGINITLTQRLDYLGINQFTIDCFKDEWILLGVGVYCTRWMNPFHIGTQTMLEKRLLRRFTQRNRGRE